MSAQHRAIFLIAIAATTITCRGERDGAGVTAMGGGPRVQEPVVTSSVAMERLREARCERVHACGIVGAGCERDAAAIHEPVLAQCAGGVRESALAACTQHVRTTPCSSMVAVAETCSARSLCDRR